MTAEHDDQISGRQALDALRRVAATRSRALARRVVQRVKWDEGEPLASPGTSAASPASAGPLPDKVPAQRVGSWDLRLADHDLAWIHKLDVQVDPNLLRTPMLNVLIPGLRQQDLSGGPNTAIQLAYRLAARGHAVRFVSTDVDLDPDTEPLWQHMAALTGLPEHLPNVEVTSAQKPGPLWIGEDDLFLATAWWTAQLARTLLPQVRPMRFLYLIQDYEPRFFAASTTSALADETYALDHVPIVNSQLLLDHLVATEVGRFADPTHVARAAVLEPAVDRTRFRFGGGEPRSVRRVLVYSRPANGLRNLSELAVAALRFAHQRGAFADGEWEFLGIGEDFPDQPLGDGDVLRASPWKDFDGYAAQMRDSDLLLSLMLSPHPSYPPLEMAACGGLVVTNSFGVKTPERMAAVSANILVADPTIESVADQLLEAVRRLANVEARRDASELGLPSTWDEAFAPVLDSVERSIAEIRSGPDRLDEVWRTAPRSEYDAHRLARIDHRRALYPSVDAPADGQPVLSLLTPAWNTDPGFLRILARSVLAQDGSFEWVIVDNGSDRPETIAALSELSSQPSVRFARLDRNDGIIAGMRACLDLATGTYVAPLDHDDLLAPDATQVVTAALSAGGWPALFYTDEDKLDLDVFFGPYHKPDWDPVLFANSCYIAHLCGIRRDLAIELGAYDDPRAEASPDWDLFTRATLAGHVPLHVPEVLYSWRVHHGSTARGHEAKANVGASHTAVLDKLHAAIRRPDLFTLEPNPRSPGANDWWFRRRRSDAPAIGEVVIEPATSLDALGVAARAVVESLVHVVARGATPVDDEWSREAAGLFERFDDAAVVGGRIVASGRVVDGPGSFGVGRGWDSLEVGQRVDDFGHLDLTAKQRTVDVVPADHCVVRSDVLLDAIDAMRAAGAPVSTLAAWIGAAARRGRRRVITSPHIVARADTTLDSRADDDARHHFLVANRELVASTPTLSPRVDRRVERAWRPTDDATNAAHVRALLERPDADLPSYAEWLEARIAARAALPLPSGAASMAVITPVYAGTEPDLLAALAESLRAQVLPASEWIIATDGPVPTALEAELGRLAASHAEVRVLTRERGGILATMRTALDAATADYVVPVDGDDLLTVDALATLARAIDEHGRPALVFSDEDIIDRSGPRDPFERPGWDPVLHAASSYVWHVLAFRRDVALAVGAYTDPALEWCHDWDTVDRIAAAGHTPVHVAEVLYHWRHHRSSSTNTSAPTGAQRSSVEHLLQRTIDHTAEPHHYAVAEVPVWRGASEAGITRLAIDAPDVAMLVTGTDAAAFARGVARTNDCPITWWGSWDGSTLGALRAVLEHIEEPVVAVASDRIDLRRAGWLWEAVGLLERHADAGAVCGRLADPMGTVVSGPMPGHRLDDPGPFALALKPHTVATVEPQLLVADRVVLLDALRALDPGSAFASSGNAIGTVLAAKGWRVAFTPLLEATTVAPVAPAAPGPPARWR